MYFSSLLTTASLLAPTLAVFVSVTYDPIYDVLERPLSELTCWDKDTGLGSDYDLHIQANVIPMIIAIDTVNSPKSAGCMSCWVLEYEERARPFLVLDHANSGFVVSLGGMNSLTAGKAMKLGRIDANATEVELLSCGLVQSSGQGIIEGALTIERSKTELNVFWNYIVL